MRNGKHLQRSIKYKKTPNEIIKLKNTTEKENFLEGSNSTGKIIQDTIIELEKRSIKFIISEQQREKDWGEKNEQSTNGPWENNSISNILMGIPLGLVNMDD